MRKLCISLATVVHVILGANLAIAQYTQTNLVADEKGHAVYTDPLLVNGWGLAFFPHGPFWVADAGTGMSTVYGPHGKPLPIAVTIPAAPSLPVGHSRFAYRVGCQYHFGIRYFKGRKIRPRDDSFLTPRTERSAGGTRKLTPITRSPSSTTRQRNPMRFIRVVITV